MLGLDPFAKSLSSANSKFDCNCRRFRSALLGVGCVQIWSARVAKFPLRDLPRAPLDFLVVSHVCISAIDMHVSRTTGRPTAGCGCGFLWLWLWLVPNLVSHRYLSDYCPTAAVFHEKNQAVSSQILTMLGSSFRFRTLNIVGAPKPLFPFLVPGSTPVDRLCFSFGL